MPPPTSRSACRTLVALIALMLFIHSGCTRRINPSFPLTDSEARSALDEMAADPKRLDRPLVLLGGFSDVGIGASILHRKMRGLFDHPDVLVLTFADCTSFEQCRQRVIDAVDTKFGRDESNRTVEVDVVGQSMGGLVAVVSAADFGDGARRLNARRIFTLSSPLRGARLAEGAPLVMTPMHRDMRPQSDLYRKLAAAQIDAELYCYTRLDDRIVGEEFASLEGRDVWWVDTPPFQLSHLKGITDDRILADIVRRLRGEQAFATLPATPLHDGTR